MHHVCHLRIQPDEHALSVASGGWTALLMDVDCNPASATMHFYPLQRDANDFRMCGQQHTTRCRRASDEAVIAAANGATRPAAFGAMPPVTMSPTPPVMKEGTSRNGSRKREMLRRLCHPCCKSPLKPLATWSLAPV
eukprot:scaffold12824_cov26-Tisochrysis_lutea.AAC.6